jgi:hypothetical protein
MNLAPLTGSPKQIEWGEDRRAAMLAVVANNHGVYREHLAGNDAAIAILDGLKADVESHVEAMWWIEQTGNGAELLWRALVEAVKAGRVAKNDTLKPVYEILKPR